MELNPEIPFNEDDIESIVAAYLAGDPNAEWMLMKRYEGHARFVVHRYTTNKKEEEDIISESFIKMFNNRGKYNSSEGTFKTWFTKILINTALDSVKRNTKFKKNIPIADMENVSNDEDITSKMAAADILKFVDKLPNAGRTVFLLYAEGYSHKEIAEKLDIAEVTSRSNFRDAKDKLKLMLQHIYPHLFKEEDELNSTFNDNL